MGGDHPCGSDGTIVDGDVKEPMTGCGYALAAEARPW